MDIEDMVKWKVAICTQKLEVLELLFYLLFDILTSLEKTTDGLSSNKAGNLHIIVSSMVGSPSALMITVILLHVS